MSAIERINEPVALSPVPLPNPAPDHEPSAAAEPAATKVSIRSLHSYYGKFLAVRNVNLDIAEGQITAIIGPTRRGTSTLLRSINRMNAQVPCRPVTGATSPTAA